MPEPDRPLAARRGSPTRAAAVVFGSRCCSRPSASASRRAGSPTGRRSCSGSCRAHRAPADLVLGPPDPRPVDRRLDYLQTTPTSTRRSTSRSTSARSSRSSSTSGTTSCAPPRVRSARLRSGAIETRRTSGSPGRPRRDDPGGDRRRARRELRSRRTSASRGRSRSRSPSSACCCGSPTGCRDSADLEDIALEAALVIGVAQVLALMPGVSRSGITITAGRFSRLDRDAAARFSFLLLVPIVLGAVLYKGVKDVVFGGCQPARPGRSWSGRSPPPASASSAIELLLGYVRRHDYTIFVIYRLALAAAILILILTTCRPTVSALIRRKVLVSFSRWPTRFLRRARDRKRSLGPRRRRVGRARRRPRRRRDEGLAPVVQLREGAGRDPGRLRRGRLARAARRGRLAQLARDGGPAPRRDSDQRGASGDPLARGARRRVHAGERRLPARDAAAAPAQAPAPGRRPHGPRDHEGAARGRGRPAPARRSPNHRCARSSRPRTAGAHASASTRSTPATVVLAAGGRCFKEAEERGELSTNHPGATGEVTRIALGLGAEARDLDALQYHPNGGAWPANMQGYSIPETTRAYGAVLLNADGEEFTDSLGPRDAVSQAIFDEVAKGKGVETPDGRPAVLPRHDADPEARRRRLAPVHAAPLPRRRESTRSPSRSSPTLCSTTRTAAS